MRDHAASGALGEDRKPDRDQQVRVHAAPRQHGESAPTIRPHAREELYDLAAATACVDSRQGPAYFARMPRRWNVLVVIIAALPVAARATDLQGRRYYLALRYAESNPLSDAHDAVGLSLGINLNRYLGVELAANSYELRTEVEGASALLAGASSIGDLGVGTFIPQARLRYPVLHDRLVPYLIGGMGLAITQFNDRKIGPSHTVDLRGNMSPMGALGGGLEYHVADNVALGVEAKYLIGAEQTIDLDGVSHDESLDAGMIAFSMRFLYPQLDPDHAPGSRASDTTNLYFGVRAGLARPVHEHVFGEVTADVENASIGGSSTSSTASCWARISGGGHYLRIGAGPEMAGNLDSLLLNIGLRVFVFELGRSS
jgi:opacity protein-like surface antigen